MSNNSNDRSSGPEQESLGLAGKTARMFIHSPLTPLFLVALLLMGLLGLYITPRQEDPQISVPMADIFFEFPGASSRQVASLATNPLERMMSEIPGVRHVYSASERGRGMVTVQFIVGEEMGPSLVKLYDKLASNRDKIPPGVTGPLVKPRGVDDVPAVTLTLWSKDLSDAELRQLALEVTQRLKEVPDTAQSFIVGGRSQQMRVEFLPERLKGYAISVDQLAAIIRAANNRQDVGGVETGGRSLDVYAGKFLRHAKDLETLVVGVRNGSPVYLRDVATVTEGPGEADSLVQYFSGPAAAPGAPHTDGAPAVTIAIAKKSGTNGVNVANAILAKVEALKGRIIPDNVNVSVTRNYGETANDKVNELLGKMVAATTAVCFLIFLFLGLRPMIVVGLIIPIVVLITVFAAWLLDYTIDRVSLFALIFSIGILVDDATVVVENMYRRWLQKGKVDTKTTVDAVDEVGNPTILATFAIIAALLPMGMVSGMMGPYMMPIPVLGSVAMLFSLLAAFVFTPWLAIRIRPSLAGIKKMEESEHKFAARLDKFFRALLGPLLDSRSKARIFRISIWMIFLLCCSLFYFQLVTVKMLPLDNKPEFNVVLNMKDGTALPVTANVIQEMTEAVRRLPEVTAVQTYSGTASPFNFNGLVRHYYLRQKPWQGDIQVQLLHKNDRDRSSHEVAVEARKLLTPIARKYDAKIAVVEMPPGPPVLQTMVAEIYGPDAETRRQVARDMTLLFEKAETIVDVDNYMQDPHDTWVFQVNQRKAEHRNVSIGDISQQLSMVMGGYRLGSVKLGHELEPHHIILQAPLGVRGQISRLGEIPIRARDDKLVPLAELGKFVPQKQDPVIFHKDLRPIEYVTGEVAGRLAAPVYSMIEISKLLNDYKTPDGVTLSGTIIGPPDDSFKSGFEWTGEWTVTYETFRDMGGAFMVALVLIYMLVVLEFGNFRLPGIIMAPIPLTLIGIIPGHWLLGAEFTATSMIGWIALAGIIVRNSILLVDYSKTAIQQGMETREAVIQAVCARTRPILITQLTMIAGSASIITDPIFQGMAISLLFGAVIATGLTLVVIPLACANATGAYATAADNVMEDEVAEATGGGGSSQGGAPGSKIGALTGKIAALATGAADAVKSSASSRGKTSGAWRQQLAAVGPSIKERANRPGYAWLQPIYLIGAFSAEATRHLLGRTEANKAVGTPRPSARKKGSAASAKRGAARSSKSTARTQGLASTLAKVLAPVKEAFGHLLGRAPALAAATAAGGSRTGSGRRAAALKSKTAKSQKRSAGVASGRRSNSKTVDKSDRKTAAKTGGKTGAKSTGTRGGRNGSKAPAKAKTAKSAAAKKSAKTVAANTNNAAKPAAKRKPAGKTNAGAKTKTASRATAAKRNRTPDDLQEIAGIGPALVKKLKASGVTQFEQIARWKKSDVEEFDDMLNFKGRIGRENWVNQAKSLSRKVQMRAANAKLKSTAKKKASSQTSKRKSG